MRLERHQIDIDHKILMSCISRRLQFNLKVKQSQTVCCQNKIPVQLFCAACRVGLMALRAQEKLDAQEEISRHKVCVKPCECAKNRHNHSVTRYPHCLHVCESEKFTWLISHCKKSFSESIFLSFVLYKYLHIFDMLT